MLSRGRNNNNSLKRSQAQTRPSCPRCGRVMTVRQVTPLMFASSVDEVVYGCADCGTEAKRTVKRSEGR